MKKSKLFQVYKSLKTPMISFVFVVSIILTSIPTYFNRNLFEVFAFFFPKKLFFWQSITYFFEHSIYFKEGSGYWFLWVHMFTNIVGIVVFGIFIEKMCGSHYFFRLTLLAGVVNYLISVILFNKMTLYICGASGIVYAYILVGFYFMIKHWKKNEIKILKQPFFYVLFLLLLYYYIFISIMSSFYTVVFHLLATLTGGIYLVLSNKGGYNYDSFLEKDYANNRESVIWNILWVIPIMIIVIILLFHFGKIQTTYKW